MPSILKIIIHSARNLSTEGGELPDTLTEITFSRLTPRKTDVIKNGIISEDSKSGLRHGFRFGMKSRINERVAFENLLWVRPYQDLASWMIETDNLNISNDLKFIVSLTDKLFFDYNLIYQKDKIWKTKSGLPDSNTINSLNLRYDFSL